MFLEPFPFNLGLLTLAFLAMFAIVALSRATVRRHAGRLAAVLGVLLLVASCGGGGTKPPVQTGTPAGTSTITVTATSGSATRTFTLTLIVN
jgi:apolipoprotein N-acyltransferase